MYISSYIWLVTSISLHLGLNQVWIWFTTTLLLKWPKLYVLWNICMDFRILLWWLHPHPTDKIVPDDCLSHVPFTYWPTRSQNEFASANERSSGQFITGVWISSDGGLKLGERISEMKDKADRKIQMCPSSSSFLNLLPLLLVIWCYVVSGPVWPQFIHHYSQNFPIIAKFVNTLR